MISFTLRSFLLLLISTSVSAQTWKELGPIDFPVNQSGQINGIGRVTQMVFHPSQPHKRYATSASGGLYYTSDTGHHWMRFGTDVLPVSNLASICVDHVNDQILYVSTGDPNYYGTDYGIYKSTDGGATWNASNTGIGNLMAVDLLMSPVNNQVIVAATNNGIWQTINAGANWTVVKTGGAFTHMTAVPNSAVLLAVTATQVWRSNDGGNTWTAVNNITFGAGGSDGMRVMTNQINPQIVYIASNGNNGEIYKSTDMGLTFSSIYSSTTQCLVCYDEDPANPGQGNYDFAACCDPQDPNHLYVAAHCLWESNDGGLTWMQKTDWWKELHTDHHQFVFDPYDNNKFWSINDGGIWLREGLNDSLWMPMSDGISATEIYKAASSSLNKKLISIGTQDNGEKYMNHQGWFTNRGGDWTSRMAFDYGSSNFVYYLNNGQRRGFDVQTGQVTFNCPFAVTNNARIAFTPQQVNVGLLGKDTIWRSTNLQSSNPTWTSIYPTITAIKDMVISSADSNTAYIINNSKIVRLDNILGTPVANAVNVPVAASLRGSVATVKQNANIVYISCNAKMYRSTDAGATWNNVTYNLPNVNILKIYHDDYSNNERMYVCSGNQIFTKTLNDTIWQNMNYNLPNISNITDFMMINDSTVASKLRVSYYGRGTWEYKLNPTFPPIADFIAQTTFICPGDTVSFNDKSVDDSLTYTWSFSGGVPATSTVANPKVVYNTPGQYNVTLTVTNPYGSHTKTITAYITVSNNIAQVDTFGPGKAVYLDGSGASYIRTGTMNLQTNELTLMCWIKPDGPQNDWGGLMFCRGGNTTSGLSIKDNNEIRIHWDDDHWGTATNLFAVDNEWNHCAMVVTPTAIKIYVNGEEFITNGSFPVEPFDADLLLGADITSGSRRFKGWMDEAIVYRRALSKEEIREKMHLIKYPVLASDSLVAYWQCNNITSGNTILNAVNCKYQGHANAFTPLVNSTAPLGIGNSKRITLSSGGNISIVEADLACGFPSSGSYPDGEVVFTHIRNNPDVMPANSDYSGNYWILDNYGNNAVFTGLDSLVCNHAGNIIGVAADYQLYRRTRNADGNSWGNALGTAVNLVNGNPGSIKYGALPSVNQAGQYINAGKYYPVGITEITASSNLYLYPNPSKDETTLFLPGKGLADIYVYASAGHLVQTNLAVKNNQVISLHKLNKGVYIADVIYQGKTYQLKLIKE